MRYYIEV